MQRALQELLELLELEPIDENVFRGQSQDLGWGALFGGQVVGQALSAAGRTVPADRAVHSFHGDFLRQGDVSQPIVFQVDRLRDGKSFTTRRVVAAQKGRPIFSLSASFQVEEAGFDHQQAAPVLQGPDGLCSERELARAFADRIPEPLRAQATIDRAIEFRPLRPADPLAPRKRPPHRELWCRASDTLPDRPSLHQFLLAYASDFHFLTTSLEPHGVSWLTAGMHIASLNHAMWFHRPFRMDEWLCYVIDSPSASCARALVRGQIFTREGSLVASTAQEGLIRVRA